MKLNCVLKTFDEVSAAISNLKQLGLPPHPDLAKSWDTWKFIDFINNKGKKNSKVLDVGCNGSPVLSYLRRLGFENLYGCDLNLESRKPLFLLKAIDLIGYKKLKPLIEMFENKDGFYNLEKQDLEKTNYQSNFFEFITSLSVIEHGINLEKYFSEMNRILKTGGYLLTTTDYWPEKVSIDSNVYDTKNNDLIFSREEIDNLIEISQKKNFELYEPVDFDYKDRVVHWKKTGQKYTFIFLCFKKI